MTSSAIIAELERLRQEAQDKAVKEHSRDWQEVARLIDAAKYQIERIGR